MTSIFSLPAAVPGQIHYVVVFQSEVWIDGEGREWAIGDMTDEHLVNVLAYLERRAERIWYATWLHQAALLHNAPDEVWAEDAEMTPREWLLDTPLFRALTAELERRAEANLRAALQATFGAKKRSRRLF